MPTPEAQYRFAQTRADDHELLAAWIAVPARFPNSAEWSFRAYVQLTRLLVRRGAAQKLEALAQELETAQPPNSPHSSRWQTLAKIAHAGADAARGDGRAVVDRLQYNPNDLERIEPELAEVSIEVLQRARASAGSDLSLATRLENLRQSLARPLQLDDLPTNLAPPR
jgi:site-specific recombinase